MNETVAAEAQAIADLVTAVGAVSSDELVTKLVGSTSRLLEVLGSSEGQQLMQSLREMLPGINRFAKTMVPLVKAGALDRIADLLTFAMAATDVVTDAQVESLAGRAESLLTLADSVMRRDPADLWKKGFATATGAWQTSAGQTDGSSLHLLLQLLRDPATRRLLHFAMAAAHEVGA